MDLILASASPRRRALLQQIGVSFYCRPVDVDESLLCGEGAADYVLRLAREKTEQGLKASEGSAVMGADTAVVVDDSILGKPSNEGEAVGMLLSLANRSHQVLTAVALSDGERFAWRVSRTVVTFGPISEAQCRRYWHTGEPADKAGAYGIQGMGAVFVEKIEGSYSGVVGLPLAETRVLLEMFNIPYWADSATEDVS